jgi:GT2 family glycosyltransferase
VTPAQKIKGWLAGRGVHTVTVCIPTTDRLDLLVPCLASLADTAGPSVTVIIGDTGSVPETLAFYKEMGLRVIQMPEPFSFSRCCNEMAKAADSPLLLFLNNDTAAVTPDWFLRVLRAARREAVLGALLIYPGSRLIQHAGVDVFATGGVWSRGSYLPTCLADFPYSVRHIGVGEPVSALVRQDFSRMVAVTGAFLCLPKPTFHRLGGFDESYVTDLQDTDLCLTARKAGVPVRCLWDVVFTHAESASRSGYTFPLDDWRRFDARWRSEFETLAGAPVRGL